jgi:formamidopyrimidine-DNA glycosylase
VPELPEVETVVRDLQPRLVGRRITAVEASQSPLRRPWLREWEVLLVGRRIEAVRRRGKWIVLYLKGGSHLVIHLGMTGQLTVQPNRQPSAAHTHLVFHLAGGREQLRFRDIRRFGSATLLTGRENLERFFEDALLGPEPFDVDAKYWRQCLESAGRSLKAVLLDQRVVAGVGNIYADESLFEARLHPSRLARELNADEAARLRRAIVRVLERAIERRGSSIRNYVGGSGLKGQYQEEFRVYGRFAAPCPRCRTPIARIRLAGRATHFCPRCQPSANGQR